LDPTSVKDILLTIFNLEVEHNVSFPVA